MTSYTDKRFCLDKINNEIWVAPFAREMDLTIAANVIESFNTRETLYDRVLCLRVADRVLPLDSAIDPTFLGVIKVQPMPDEPWRQLIEPLENLASKPRGNWAIFELEGKYDSYMSTGQGGVATESGHKFLWSSPTAPVLTFMHTYSCLIGWEVYNRRNRIEGEINQWSAKEGMIHPGTIWKDSWLNGVKWANIRYLAEETNYYVGGTSAYRVRATRRGAKAKEFILEASAFRSIAQVECVLPPQYQDEHNPARTSSLHERRQKAATAAFIDHASKIVGLHPRNTTGAFREDADQLIRHVYTCEAGCPDKAICSHIFTVDFEPGVDIVKSLAVEPIAE